MAIALTEEGKLAFGRPATIALAWRPGVTRPAGIELPDTLKPEISNTRLTRSSA